MKYSYVLALLPALAFTSPIEERADPAHPEITKRATPAQSSAAVDALNSAYPGCSTITDEKAYISCVATAEGFNQAAASYYADNFNTELAAAEVGLLTDKAYASKVIQLSNSPVALISAEMAQASKLGSQYNKDLLTSVDAVILSLEGAMPTYPPNTKMGGSEDPNNHATTATYAGNTMKGGSENPNATTAPAASQNGGNNAASPSASTSGHTSSSSNYAVPTQASLGFAAAAAAGVAGLALAL